MRIRSIVLAVAMFGFTAVPAMAQNGVKAGLLSCRTGPSVGLIIGSHQHMHCRFDPDNGGPAEAYSGAITRVGLDVGIRARESLRFRPRIPRRRMVAVGGKRAVEDS